MKDPHHINEARTVLFMAQEGLAARKFGRLMRLQLRCNEDSRAPRRDVQQGDGQSTHLAYLDYLVQDQHEGIRRLLADTVGYSMYSDGANKRMYHRKLEGHMLRDVGPDGQVRLRFLGLTRCSPSAAMQWCQQGFKAFGGVAEADRVIEMMRIYIDHIIPEERAKMLPASMLQLMQCVTDGASTNGVAHRFLRKHHLPELLDAVDTSHQLERCFANAVRGTPFVMFVNVIRAVVKFVRRSEVAGLDMINQMGDEYEALSTICLTRWAQSLVLALQKVIKAFTFLVKVILEQKRLQRPTASGVLTSWDSAVDVFFKTEFLLGLASILDLLEPLKRAEMAMQGRDLTLTDCERVISEMRIAASLGAGEGPAYQSVRRDIVMKQGPPVTISYHGVALRDL